MVIVANPIAQTIFDKVIIGPSCRKSLDFKKKVLQLKELVLQESRIENPHKERKFGKRVNNIVLDPISQQS